MSRFEVQMFVKYRSNMSPYGSRCRPDQKTSRPKIMKIAKKTEITFNFFLLEIGKVEIPVLTFLFEIGKLKNRV